MIYVDKMNKYNLEKKFARKKISLPDHVDFPPVTVLL